MKSTRDKILQKLLKYPRSSINELAQSVDINAISVRHHLTNLQAEGLVIAEEERHGVGRPRLVYSLTEIGVEQFPSSYLRFTNILIDKLKETLSREELNSLFTMISDDIISNYETDFVNLELEDKLDLMKKVLSELGYSIEWSKDNDQYLIHEMGCPYYHLGQNHPEICQMDITLFSKLLSLPIKQVNCLLNGDSHCTFIISRKEIV